MISDFNPLVAASGGVLIGLAATLMLAGSGRVAGISGIVGGLLRPARGEAAWRVAFVVGLVVAGLALLPVLPEGFVQADRPTWLLVPAGLLVGFGTRLGNGCTSGHGVCGMARFSKRSFAAVGVFLVTGVVTATVAGLVLRGAA